MTHAPSDSVSDLKQPLVDGEFPFTRQDFRRISDILHSDVGIVMVETKAPLIYSRLVKRLRQLGLQSFRDYCALVMSSAGDEERRQMLSALTTNVTSFFRERYHFDHLKQAVLPRLLAGARKGGRVRIWSAGCSNGMEAYSIALTILSLAPDAANLDIRILASDIDHLMLAEGRTGKYDAKAITPLSRDMKARWFSCERAANGEESWEAGKELRALVAFRELNLMQKPWPMRGPFQIIFCRNVLMYFDLPTQAEILGRFVPFIAPEGRLYLGHSERLNGGANQALDTEQFTIYRRKAKTKDAGPVIAYDEQRSIPT